MKENLIEIDGAWGEGGGQILRTAFALSAITKRAFRIKNIRIKREKSGLQPQHLSACLSAHTVCKGNLIGAALKSHTLTFEPDTILGGDYELNIGTAGSTILVAQTLLPMLLYAEKPSTLRIVGGTHVRQSPGYDYFQNIFLPSIARFGAKVEAQLVRSGYYPKGGGIIQLLVTPTSLKGNSDWNHAYETQGIIRICKLPISIAEREKKVLEDLSVAQIQIVEESASSEGNALTLWRGFNGACAVGERGKRAENVASELALQLREETGEVDRHLADQLLIYACLAQGETFYCTSAITLHLKTNAAIISKFLERKIQLENTKVYIS